MKLSGDTNSQGAQMGLCQPLYHHFTSFQQLCLSPAFSFSSFQLLQLSASPAFSFSSFQLLQLSASPAFSFSSFQLLQLSASPAFSISAIGKLHHENYIPSLWKKPLQFVTPDMYRNLHDKWTLEKDQNEYFEFKKLVGCQDTPELELLLFAPILHETLTNSKFDTNTICQLSHGSSFKCKLKSLSQQKCFADCLLIGITF